MAHEQDLSRGSPLFERPDYDMLSKLRHVDAVEWERIAATMRAAFKEGRFEAGLNQAIDAVDVLLARHYALASGTPNPNELPDAPELR